MPQKSPVPASPVHHWEKTNNPWVRLHNGYAGLFQAKMFSVAVDSSKWLKAIIGNNSSSTSTIKSLQNYFITHRFSQVTILDNRPVYTSEEFEFFVKTSGMKHIKSAPYHPAINRCAERAVRTFKTTTKKVKDIESMPDILQTFLFQYCITTQSRYR